MRRTGPRSVTDHLRAFLGGVAVTISTLCWLVAVLGSLGCAGVQSFHWLRDGDWPHWTNDLIFDRAGLRLPLTGWVGAEKLVESFIRWPLWSGILLLGMAAAIVAGALASLVMKRESAGA